MRSDVRLITDYIRNHGGRFSMAPQPFAGEFPTRIVWWVQFRNRTFEKYAGKPSRMNILRLLKLLRKADAISVYFYELDRTGVIAAFTGLPRSLDEFRVELSRTYRFYHPWKDVRFGWEWMLTRWYVKKIKLSRGIAVVYSPRAVLDKEVHIQPYKKFAESLWPS